MYVLQKFIVCWIVYPGRINLCFAVICHLCISCYQLGECTDYPKQIIYLFTGQARDPPLPSPLLAHPASTPFLHPRIPLLNLSY